MLFDKKNYTQDEVRDMCNRSYNDGFESCKKGQVEDMNLIKSNHAIEISKMESDHNIALATKDSEKDIAIKEKEFEVRHQMDDDKKTLLEENNTLKTKLAVAEADIKMLDRIVDLDSDIIDVKDVVNKLIDKLPNIDITQLAIGKRS